MFLCDLVTDKVWWYWYSGVSCHSDYNRHQGRGDNVPGTPEKPNIIHRNQHPPPTAYQPTTRKILRVSSEPQPRWGTLSFIWWWWSHSWQGEMRILWWRISQYAIRVLLVLLSSEAVCFQLTVGYRTPSKDGIFHTFWFVKLKGIVCWPKRCFKEM